MSRFLKYFHYLSYLQYVFLVWALFYWIMIFIGSKSYQNIYINYSLILFGISISFTSFYNLKNKKGFSDKLFLKPKLFKVYIVYVLVLSFSLLFWGIYLYFFAASGKSSDISIGLIVLGIGVLNLLKMSIERANILME